MSRINVTISRIVLRGFEPDDRSALVEALQTELRDVLTDPVTRGTWAHTQRTELLNLGRIPFSAGRSGSRDFGSRMARAIGKGLKS
jgi:hypothetical protein